MTELQDIEEQYRRSMRTRYARRAGWAVLILAFIFAFILFVVRDHYRGQAMDELGTALNNQREQFDECVNAPANDPQCQEPIEPPADDIVDDIGGPVDVGPMGPAGPAGPGGPAPSATEIQQAVNNYCSSTGRCDGKSATATQVARAVALYCNARGECEGPQGTTGEQGPEGTTGEQGEQGPPPAPDQIQAAVLSYCSNQPDGDCVGPQGDPGQPGQDGSNGRGIKEVLCNQETREFVIVYNDDTRQPVEGSECKPEPEGPPITPGP